MEKLEQMFLIVLTALACPLALPFVVNNVVNNNEPDAKIKIKPKKKRLNEKEVRK